MAVACPTCGADGDRDELGWFYCAVCDHVWPDDDAERTPVGRRPVPPGYPTDSADRRDREQRDLDPVPEF